MYSEASILALANRIGFGTDKNIAITVSPIHKIGASGRLLSWFHKLANLDNIYNTVNEISMSEQDFNEYLAQMKYDAAKAVLTSVLNKNKKYLDDFDYSDTILLRPELFDDAIGYTLTINAIEQMISTTRSNDNEAKAKLTYNQLKVELEGLTDDSGRVMSKGLKREQFFSIRNASKIIFPSAITISSPNVW